MKFNLKSPTTVQSTVFKDFDHLINDIAESLFYIRAYESISIYAETSLIRTIIDQWNIRYGIIKPLVTTAPYSILTIDVNWKMHYQPIQRSLPRSESTISYLHDTIFTTKTLLELNKNDDNILCFSFKEE